MGVMSKARGLGLGIMIWALAVPIFLFTLFPLISSTSNGLSGIYLLTHKWNDDDHSWLRLGYYGLCIVHSKHGGDHCMTTTGRSSKDLVKGFNIDTDNKGTFNYDLKLQHDVFVAFLTAGGVIWFISLVFISLVILRGSSAGRLIRSAAKVTSLAGATLMIASAWATNSAVKALEVSTNGSVQGGTLLYGLQWVAAILAFVFAYAVSSVADSEGGSKAYHLGRV
ncbi:unnamed protein product [Aureobasidium vineae]|uniref:Uncharacterized protein n=1 Tax=Aureobasidium vineae TaxID=2773715 RepID=A0A9N8J984_9PEZI|nr:unnamed protein product [Aureobasidium vineae]